MGRIEAADRAGNEVDARIVSDLVDEIQDAVMEYQVSSAPIGFHHPLIKTADTDHTTANYIRSKSRTDCEWLKWMFVNMPDR